MRPLLNAVSALGLGGALVVGACNFDITNPNSPTEIGDGASQQRVAAAMDGLLIATRADIGAPGGWVLKSAILGREAYRIDAADPRFVTELLQASTLDPSNDAFGGGQWRLQYAAIRSGYNVLNVIGTAQLTDAQKEGVRGFIQTIQAYSYTILLDAHTEDSIPIDVNHPLNAPLAPFVSNAEAWAHLVSLLDSAKTHLLAAGGAFAFSLPPGFAGFDTPVGFLKVNRALLARAYMYRAGPFAQNTLNDPCVACYDSVLAALGESFVDTTASLDLGVYFDFSANSGDATNGLSQQVSSAIQLVHPSIRDSVATKPGGGLDNRYTAKVANRGSPFCSGARCSDLSWIRYPSPGSSIPIIRNEELILLRAEANNWLGKADSAAADINFIRVNSGGLSADPTLSAANQTQVEDEILVQRKYSLMYEGQRWVDMRRTGRLNQMILDLTGDHIQSTLPVNSFEVSSRK